MNEARFFLSRAHRYGGRLAFIALLSLAQAAALLVLPWAGGSLLGAAVAGSGSTAGPVVALVVAALAAVALFAAMTSAVSATTAARILADLRAETHAHVIALPQSAHDRRRQGELLSLMTWEVSGLSRFLTDTLATMPSMVLAGAGALVALVLLDPGLALAIPVLVPLFVIGVRLAGRRMRRLAAGVREAEVAVVVEAETQLGLVNATKAFAVEPQQGARYRERLDRSLDAVRRQALTGAFVGPAIGFAAACAAIGVLVLASERVAIGALASADLFRFLLYAALLTRPVAALGQAWGSFQVARGALRALRELLADPVEPGSADLPPLPPVQGAIAFTNVRFAYDERAAVLEGATFAIAPGEIVALTGANGAGKSTIVSLLMRFYDPQSGRITIDGHDTAAVGVRSLRRQIGLVPQRPSMGEGTVRDAVAFADPDASDSVIERALYLAQALEFVAALPQGLDTHIGEQGVLLSGGQRQRLALARALLLDPPVLVFDEATSMIDTEGEAAFIEACRSALHGRTVIIVSHRPASLALASRVLEVADGCVREV